MPRQGKFPQSLSAAASPRMHVHFVIEFIDDGTLPMAAIAEAGGAQDWLADEPELYSDSDIVGRMSAA